MDALWIIYLFCGMIYSCSGDNSFYINTGENEVTRFELHVGLYPHSSVSCGEGSTLAFLEDECTYRQVGEGLFGLREAGGGYSQEVWVQGRTDSTLNDFLALQDIRRTGPYCAVLSNYNEETLRHNHNRFRLFTKDCSAGDRGYLCRYPPEPVIDKAPELKDWTFESGQLSLFLNGVSINYPRWKHWYEVEVTMLHTKGPWHKNTISLTSAGESLVLPMTGRIPHGIYVEMRMVSAAGPGPWGNKRGVIDLGACNAL